MHEANIDLAVLIIFFARPNTLQEVFAQVKKARPSKLFLACDGPRENCPTDVELIARCKEIVSDIDWKCEVHLDYADKNMGCGVRPYTAIKKAFHFVDKLVVLEDDCVPHDSFFPYMEEMLEKYKNDTRIGLISGFNHFQKWDCGEYSYFYTRVGPMAGAWGCWKRVWDEYSYGISLINEPLIERLLFNDITHKRARKEKIKIWKLTANKIHNGENINYWDIQFGFLKFLMSYLSVVPKFSLASNIGLGKGSTHAQRAQNVMPSIFFAPDRNFEFPIQHPPFIICDHEYDDMVDKTFGYPNPFVRQIKRILRVINRFVRVVVRKVNYVRDKNINNRSRL